MSERLNLMILGKGRHGKDTFAEIAASEDFGYEYTPTSYLAAEIVIYGKLKEKHGYTTVEECFDDRHQHRAEWHDLIHEYNHPHLYLLGETVFKTNDIYCGLRNKEEFDSMVDHNLIDLTIWIDATDRLGNTEGIESMSLTKESANIIITNNGTEEDFKAKIVALLTLLTALESLSKNGRREMLGILKNRVEDEVPESREGMYTRSTDSRSDCNYGKIAAIAVVTISLAANAYYLFF